MQIPQMDTQVYWASRLEHIETSIIEELQAHPVLFRIKNERVENPDFFYELLLQRRFISHTITNIYDLAIDSDIDKACKVTLRRILREEYPDSSGNYPSHREDLVTDLQLLGITLNDILQSRPSAETKYCIEASFNKLLEYSAHHSEIQVLAFTRFIGEVLVGEEYKILWPRISSILGDSAKAKSRFFWPHIRHDSRTKFTDPVTQASTHASYLGISLIGHVNSDHDVELFSEAEQAAFNIKSLFYDQYVSCLAAST